MATNNIINMNNTPSDNMKNIVKMFDPFEILQPTKPEAVPKENLLVDLSDNQHTKEVTDGINGSLLDRTTKSEFDVVDLFQNMFINPEHVSKNGKNQTESIEKNDNRDWIKDFDCIDYVNDVKVDILNDLTSIFTQPLNTPATALDDDEEEDKLIDEVRAMKRIEKDLLRSHHGIHSDNYKRSENIKSLSLSVVHQKIDEENGKHKDDQISITAESTTINDPRPMRVLPEIFHHHNIYKTTTQNVVTGNNNEAAKLSNANCIIQAVKLDKKKYQKRQMLSDDEKVGYTKGPDLFEKSIALPPMLERIKARQKFLEERKCRKRRLILAPDNAHDIVHEGTSTTLTAETPVSLNPIVLTDNCNRDKYIAWKAGRAFEKFVFNGNS